MYRNLKSRIASVSAIALLSATAPGIRLLDAQTILSSRHSLSEAERRDGNYWVRYNKSDTVIVFVHGVNSDARDTWLHTRDDAGEEVFWPDLVASDPAFAGAAIFVAGYPANHQTMDAMNTTLAVMRVQNALSDSLRGDKAVLQRRHILFVTHSLGGIVTRGLVMQTIGALGDKDIGILLIASPADGAFVATVGQTVFGRVFGVQPGTAGYHLLRDLDRDNTFLNGLNSWSDTAFTRRGPPRFQFVGSAVCETEKVYHAALVVDEPSCAKYFRPDRLLYGYNHFTIVKPANLADAPHGVLLDFYQDKFHGLVLDSPNRLHQLDIAAIVKLIGGKPDSDSVVMRLPLKLPLGKTVLDTDLVLPKVPEGVRASLDLAYAPLSDTTLRLSIASVTPTLLHLQIQSAAVDSSAATISADTLKNPLPVLRSFGDSTVNVFLTVRRNFVRQGQTLNSAVTESIHLTPSAPVGYIPLPAFAMNPAVGSIVEITYRLIEPMKNGGTSEIFRSQEEIHNRGINAVRKDNGMRISTRDLWGEP